MRRPTWLLLSASLAWVQPAPAEMLVIVHAEAPVVEMTPREVSDLFLGRSRSLGGAGPAGIPAQVFEQAGDSEVRERFFRSLNGMRLPALNAYWARLRFSGEVLPPRELADSRAVVEAVSRTPGAIGYVDAGIPLPAGARVVLRLGQ